MRSSSKLAPTTDEKRPMGVVIATAAVFFEVRAVGRPVNATWRGGSGGLLRYVVLDGLQSVRQLAASQQRVEKLLTRGRRC